MFESNVGNVTWMHRPEPDYSRLVWEEANRFRVHTSAYTDPTVFAAEMKHIFQKTWVYVGHESQIPESGNFITSYIGNQPVIVVRDEERQIHVLVNRCVHRGAVVCREGGGRASEFNCPYHGWVYGLDGKLLAVSERKDAGGYDDAFDAPEGLFKVPRVERYRGLIFASFNPAVQPLVPYLGRAKQFIDRKLNFSPEGEIVLSSKPFVVRYPGNWKFQAENIVDGYHFMHTHKGFVQLQMKYGDSTGDFGVHKGGTPKAMRALRFRGAAWRCENGHGLIEKPLGEVDSLFEGEFGDYQRALHDTYGEEEFSFMAGKLSGSIFPNLGLIHNQIRVWRPIAHNMTEVAVYPYELKGAPDAFNEGMLRSQERFYGPAGHGAADDVDIFIRNQQGLEASAVDWLILERGLSTDAPDAGSRDLRGGSTSEAPQRAIWSEWKRLMSAGADQKPSSCPSSTGAHDATQEGHH
ncbi:aromatic ring-hydroxylating oxygenase subunit alpha [Pararobbsia silviterrae]|nr:Rieske 2Fe-2S domain-containing protein [Pararobbsia silviterrae]